MTDSLNGTRLNLDALVELGRDVTECGKHGLNVWCSCKVRDLFERVLPAAGFVVVRDSSGLLNHGDELRMTSIAGVPVDLPRDHPVWTRRSSPEEIVVVASVTHGVECYDAWREDGPCQHEAEVEPT
jgi:hypothetical protein